MGRPAISTDRYPDAATRLLQRAPARDLRRSGQNFPRLQNRLNVFVGFQRLADDNALTQPGLMPTPLERSGNFSQSRRCVGAPGADHRSADGSSVPWQYHPARPHQPAGVVAARLLPAADAGESTAGTTTKCRSSLVTRQESLQSRLTQNINQRNQVFGNVSYQRTTTNANNLFGFEDENGSSAVDAQVNWNHRIAQLVSMRLRYQFTRQTNETTPYFAYRTNVSGDAGINGNNQEPVNWGPPSLIFSSGISGLNDALPRFTRNQTNAVGGDAFMSRGRHNFTIGGDVKRNHIDILVAAGSTRRLRLHRSAHRARPRRLPARRSRHELRSPTATPTNICAASSYDAYVTDDWRVGPRSRSPPACAGSTSRRLTRAIRSTGESGHRVRASRRSARSSRRSRQGP